MMHFSEVESRRFGLRVFRGKLERIDEKEISSFLFSKSVDVAMLRFPCDVQDSIHRLDRIGVPYIVADTLVYYQVDLRQYQPGMLRNQDLQFIECQPDSFDTLNTLVSSTFENYVNHYASNPFLSNASILEGYKEWAQSYVSCRQDGRISWLVMREHEYVGFATCSFVEKSGECEGVLYGVVPEHSGKGIYADMIKFSQNYFKSNGYAEMTVSTQVQNYAVQKVWTREGFTLSRSYLTVHLNSMMDYSLRAKTEIDFRISEGDVLDYGMISGDMNPVHTDDLFAQERGLRGKIAHGLRVDSLLSKYYGMDFPGPGTLFVGYSYKFLKPIYLDTMYRAIITFPRIEHRYYQSVARIVDEEGDLCLVSYNHLYC